MGFSLLAAGAGVPHSLAQEKVLSAPFADRPQRLKELAPAEQVAEYVAATLGSDPPDLRLEDAISESGAAVVPAIKDKLQRSDDDAESACLLGALARMQERGTFPVREDAELHRLFDEVLSRTGNSTARRMLHFQAQRIGWDQRAIPADHK